MSSNISLPIRFETFHSNPNSSTISINPPYTLKHSKPEFLHYHNYVELGICVSGKGLCYLNETTQEYKENDIQVILPHQPHYNVTASKETVSKWIFICFAPLKLSSNGIKPRISFISELLSQITANGVFSPDEYPRLASLIQALYNLDNCDDNYNSERIIMTCVNILIELVTISKTKDFSPQTLNNGPFDLIIPSINFVSKNIEESTPITVSDMAAVCNMSESYFRKIFTSVTGYSPKAFIDRSIANKAEELLVNTDKPISEIAASLGFDEISTFYRIFTKHFGISPSECRKMYFNKNA